MQADSTSERVAVIGAGKMGLPIACHLASHGASVTACDNDPVRVDAINAGRMPFFEPGVEKLLAAARHRNLIEATTSLDCALNDAHVVIVIVPVLVDEERRPDLRTIVDVTTSIAKLLRPGMLISYETTLPVGTTRNTLLPVLEQSGLNAGVSFNLAFSPERVKSLSVLRNLTTVPKIVGGATEACANRAEAFYSTYLAAPVMNVHSLEAAEFSKLAGMVYRDVAIAIANELASYAEAIGVDFDTVRRAANTDGEASLLQPGIGVGGHCTPVYPYFAIQDAHTRGLQLSLTALARRCNEHQPVRHLDRLEQAGARLNGTEVVLLGVAFRPGVKEHTCSPAFALAAEAERRGARVKTHDPLYSERDLQALGFTPVDLSGGRLPSVAILNTAHSAYGQTDFGDWHTRGVRYVLDGRNLWSREAVERAGITYIGVGC